MLVCDAAVTDQTGKKTLVGVFDKVWAVSFPIQQQLAIYFRITDAQGQYVFRVDYVYVDSDQILAKAVGSPVTIQDRLLTPDFVLPVAIAPIPGAGRYEFRLYANDAFIGQIGFVASQIQGRG